MNAVLEQYDSTKELGFTARRLSPSLGTEVIGFDVNRCSDEQFAALYKTWVDANGVLIVRDAQMSPEQHVAFGKRFGPPTLGAKNPDSVVAHYYHPDYPEIYRVSNKSIDGMPLGREDAGTYWHADGSISPTPPLASLLHAIEIPPYGGDTQFTNMYLAYETLSEPMKRLLQGLQAVHSLAQTVAAGNKTSYGKELVGKMEQALARQTPHPMVRVHPDSGRKCLFINPGFTSHIVGMNADESDAILQMLFKHAVQPEFIYRHRYQVNDLVVWDNRCTMHYAVSDYKSFATRYMHRVTIKGDAPIAA